MKKLVVLGVTLAIATFMVGCEKKPAKSAGKERRHSNDDEESEEVSSPVGEKTGDRMTITLPGGAKMEMVYVAPGSYMKGGEERPRLFRSKAMPTEGFWMGKYEVTQAQWESVMGNNPSCFKGADRPVDTVSWYDCQEFIMKVNEKLKDVEVRLPTGQEWECACRAGSTGDYCMLEDGTEIKEDNLDEVAWYGRQVDGGTQPVGKKRPNAFGFHDMLGNVCEWCEDIPSGNVPKGVSMRRECGGSWNLQSERCRVSQAVCNDAKNRFSSSGFRLCATAVPRDRMDGDAKTEAKKEEPAEDESAKMETEGNEAVKTAFTRTEAKEDEPAKMETEGLEAVKTAFTRTEAKEEEPAKMETEGNEAVKTAFTRTEAKEEESAKIETKKEEPPKIETKKDAPVKPEDKRDDYAKVTREPKEEEPKKDDYKTISPKVHIKAGEGRRSGDTMTIMLPDGTPMEMIYVAPGSFMMGERDKMPTRKVTLAKGFWMGKYEVTQAQWKSVMGRNPSEFLGDDKPVDNVSWNDCREFAEKVNAKLEDGMVRLPTEAEWECACRAGSTGDFGGTGAPDDMGWYADNSGKETHSVGQKKPNEWGFHDMHGNTWEWCADYFPCAPATNHAGSTSAVLRALRGGCWDVGARYCRSAWRAGNDPGYRNRRYGFRLCYVAGRSE